MAPAAQLLTASAARALARRHGIRPSKALGQNFMIDPNTVRRILRLAEVAPEDRVVEVGAGLGMLTLALARAARRVIAIEFDRSLLPALGEVVGGLRNVKVVAADAMKLDYRRLLGRGRYRFVSNLPYSIATPLLAKLLEEAPQIDDFVVLLQREVGERLTAGPGSKAYGSISVLVAFHCRAKVLGRVPPTVFWPPPRVESTLVRLARRPPPVDAAAAELVPIVRAAFSQRRKTIRNSLAASLGRPAAEVEAILASAGVDARARAESLSLKDFARIAKALT